MTKRKYPSVNTRSASDRPGKRPEAAAQPDAISRHLPSPAAIRETIESVVIAFVLALLFRTFEAEAFVIPTGSMAPTLMGRHKDVVCPKCGCPYQVSASEEVDAEGALKGEQYQTRAGTCPMCRYTASLGSDNPQRMSYPSYNGDRILVSKFAYDFRDPHRWDVIVFKFPGDATTDARTNFIKRLIGLPGETVHIEHGDVWVRRGDSPLHIARKPPEKLLAVLQPVFDNDYMPRIAKDGWPARWQSELPGDGAAAGGWDADDNATFHTDGAAGGERWLRYHHLVPSYRQWGDLLKGRPLKNLRPQLITDFTAYNTSQTVGNQYFFNPAPDGASLGLYWVGDLALRCTVDVESEKGELLFELRKAGRRFRCRLDVATGRATLSISGQDMEKFRPTAATNVRGRGRHEILFSNCDDELRLWVDGSVVRFDSAATYDDLKNYTPQTSDLEPVGVASVGAAARLSHLAILRDLYYISDLAYAEHPRLAADEVRLEGDDSLDDRMLRNRSERPANFRLQSDQFFVLGDNSARSKDGRLWGNVRIENGELWGVDNYWVPRELLIGKALFLYWPHSWNRIPYVDIPFPYFPNFGRMGLVK
jgi:signal peptidase I